MERRFCAACGSPLAEGAAFCGKCGAGIPASLPPASHAPASAENWVGASVPHAEAAAPHPAMPAQATMPPEAPPPGYGHPPAMAPGFQPPPATAPWGLQRWLLLAVGAIVLAGGAWRLGLIGPISSSPPSAPVSTGSPAPAPSAPVAPAPVTGMPPPAPASSTAPPGVTRALSRDFLVGRWSPNCERRGGLTLNADGAFALDTGTTVSAGTWSLAAPSLTLTYANGTVERPMLSLQTGGLISFDYADNRRPLMMMRC